MAAGLRYREHFLGSKLRNAYLSPLPVHSKGVIHGDVTGANVLIGDDGVGRLVDFGLSIIKAEFEGTSFITSTRGGALRYRALELVPSIDADVQIDERITQLNTMCDIYSLGSVVLEVCIDLFVTLVTQAHNWLTTFTLSIDPL